MSEKIELNSFNIKTINDSISTLVHELESLNTIVQSHDVAISELREFLASVKNTNEQLVAIANKFIPAIQKVGYFLIAVGIGQLIGADGPTISRIL